MRDAEQLSGVGARGALVPPLVEQMLGESVLQDGDPWCYIGTQDGAIQHPPSDPNGHVLAVIFNDIRIEQFRRTTVTLRPTALSRDWRGYRLHLLGRIVYMGLTAPPLVITEQPDAGDHQGQRFRLTSATDGGVTLDIELYYQQAFRPLARVRRQGDPRGDEPTVIAQRHWNPRQSDPFDVLRYTTGQRDHTADTYRQAERAASLLRNLRLDGVREAHRPSRSPEEARDELARNAITWVRGRRGRTLAEVGDRELAEVRVTGVSAVEAFKRTNDIKIADVRRRAAELLGEAT